MYQCPSLCTVMQKANQVNQQKPTFRPRTPVLFGTTQSKAASNTKFDNLSYSISGYMHLWSGSAYFMTALNKCNSNTTLC